MMRSLKYFALFPALILLFTLSLFQVFAETSDDAAGNRDVPVYVNDETGFVAEVYDDLDLLSDSEEMSLLEDMAPITRYGNVAFWSTDKKTGNSIDQARVKRLELYGYEDAVIFSINMSSRKLTIQSYGNIYKYVTDSKARSITDNASSLAKYQEYYKCASKVYSEIFKVLQGEIIPEPMKIAGFAVISFMLGITIVLCIAFSKRNNPLRAEVEEFSKIQKSGSYSRIPSLVFKNSKVVHREPSHSSGGGCGGGGGGGGGCGGGGSAGF